MKEHTKLPWISDETVSGEPCVRDANRRLVCMIADGDNVTKTAKAAFIVRACNAHEQLLEACRLASGLLRQRLINASPWGADLVEQLDAAIAAATEPRP